MLRGRVMVVQTIGFFLLTINDPSNFQINALWIKYYNSTDRLGGGKYWNIYLLFLFWHIRSLKTATSCLCKETTCYPNCSYLLGMESTWHSIYQNGILYDRLSYQSNFQKERENLAIYNTHKKHDVIPIIISKMIECCRMMFAKIRRKRCCRAFFCTIKHDI